MICKQTKDVVLFIIARNASLLSDSMFIEKCNFKDVVLFIVARNASLLSDSMFIVKLNFRY